MYVDGNEKAGEIYNINGNNYFRLRDVAYLLNGTGSQFSVEYDNNLDLIEVHRGQSYKALGNELAITNVESVTGVASRQKFQIDGVYYEDLLSEPKMYNIKGTNYLKLRDLAAAIGTFTVDYNVENNAIIIKTRDYSGPDIRPTTPSSTSTFDDNTVIDFGATAQDASQGGYDGVSDEAMHVEWGN